MLWAKLRAHQHDVAPAPSPNFDRFFLACFVISRACASCPPHAVVAAAAAVPALFGVGSALQRHFRRLQPLRGQGNVKTGRGLRAKPDLFRLPRCCSRLSQTKVVSCAVCGPRSNAKSHRLDLVRFRRSASATCVLGGPQVASVKPGPAVV